MTNLDSLATGDVVSLTPSVLAAHPGSSSLLWLVNICLPTCGFCMALKPKWKQLAKQLQHKVVVGTWDAFAYPELPPLFGATNSTPTIRAILPSLHHAGPDVVDYGGGRNLVNLLQFADMHMPDLVRVVADAKAWKHVSSSAYTQRVPRLLCFVRRNASSPTPPLFKALSTTFHGRLLVMEVRVHASTPETTIIAERFGLRTTPSFLLLRSSVPSELTAVETNGQQLDLMWHVGPPTFRQLKQFIEDTLATHEAVIVQENAPSSGGVGVAAAAAELVQDGVKAVEPLPNAPPAKRDEL